jgi:hypothetical protein
VDLPSVCNAPRVLPIGGTSYRARALTLAQLGELLAWLEDRTGAELYGAVGGLTLDQLDCLVAKGEIDGPGTLSPSEVQAMWEQAHDNGFTEPADAV